MKKLFLFLTILSFAVTSTYGQHFWQLLGKSTFTESHNEDLEMNSAGTLFYFPGGAIIYSSTNQGATWNALAYGNFGGGIYCFNIVNNDRIVAGGYGIINKSDDNGASWQWAANVTDFSGDPYICYYITKAFGDEVLAAVSDYGIWVSANNGSSWGGGFNQIGTNDIYRMKMNQDSTLYASYNGWVLRSTDFGYSWKTSTLTPSQFVTSIAFSKTNAIFIGTTDMGVLKSSDKAKTWLPANTGIEHKAVWFLTFDSSGTLWAGTDSNGVYYSTNGGVSWIQQNDGLDDITSVGVFSLPDGYIYAVTSQGYIYRSSTKVTDVEAQRTNVPSNFSLSQNYPNPFNPTTTINYYIPKTSFVTISVYDVLGREIETLVNEEKPVGTYNVGFNASKLTSGIYFYRMQAGDFVETKKLIVLK